MGSLAERNALLMYKSQLGTYAGQIAETLRIPRAATARPTPANFAEWEIEGPLLRAEIDEMMGKLKAISLKISKPKDG